jgi:type IV pilus biogenesis protein CpaD/CtpE
MMMRKTPVLLAVVLMAALLFGSCASTGKARKCNGQKAIRTPMGPM